MSTPAAEWLIRLGWASLAAGLTALAIGYLVHRTSTLSGRARAWIWWLVCLKFVVALVWCPTLEVPVRAPVAPVAPVEAAPTGEIAAGSFDRLPATATSPDRWFSWPEALLALWLTGVSLGGWRLLRELVEMRRRIRRSRPLTQGVAAEAFDRLRSQLGVRAELRRDPLGSGPQMVGWLRPRVILPDGLERSLSDDDLHAVLGHELLHVKRGDAWRSLLPAIAERLFFFHPLARLAAREFALAREAACDEAVIDRLGAAPADYGRLLIRLGAVKPSLGLPASSGSHQILKRRLQMLAQPPRRTPAFLPWAAIAVLCLFIAPVVPVAREAALEPAVEADRDDRPISRPTGSTASPDGRRVLPSSPPMPSPDDRRVPTATDTVSPGDDRDVPRPDDRAPLVAMVLTDEERPPARRDDGDAEITMVGRLELGGSTPVGFVLLEGDEARVDGTGRDVEAARRARRGDEDLFYYRSGNRSWVVRDPAAIDRIAVLIAKRRDLTSVESTRVHQRDSLGQEFARVEAERNQLNRSLKRMKEEARRSDRDDSEAEREEIEMAVVELQARQEHLTAMLRELELVAADEDRVRADRGEQGRRVLDEIDREILRLIEEAGRRTVESETR